MSYADYTVTEAGFGADLGAEKFLDVKCRFANLKPNAVVIVATIRALKLHGGADKNNLAVEDLDALKKGICNLIRHVHNIKDVYKLPCVVAINKFTSDTDAETEYVKQEVEKLGVQAIPSDVWGKGGHGTTDLAKAVVALCEKDNSTFTFAYQDNEDVKTKIYNVATKIYGAKDVAFSDKALQSLAHLEQLGISKMPVVIAKPQYSFSDDMKLLGAPTGFTLQINDIEYRGGAQFLVAIAGNMLLMPGLSKTPNAINMTIDNEGKIDGLY
jgi:formate--tetrahydrofolate ligase